MMQRILRVIHWPGVLAVIAYCGVIEVAEHIFGALPSWLAILVYVCSPVWWYQRSPLLPRTPRFKVPE